MQAPPPTFPGEVLAADYYSFNGASYLAVSDVFSQMPFSLPVADHFPETLITAMRFLFLQTGVPRIFQSDGEGAFISAAFQTFLRSLNIVHRKSSAQYPQSNGVAERTVQTLKLLHRKSASFHDFFLALVNFQNTPKPDSGVSPAQLFFGRNQRTLFRPISRQFQRPWPALAPVLLQRQALARQYHDPRVTRQLPSLLPGQPVMVHNYGGNRVAGTVLHPSVAPRAFSVQMPSGFVSQRTHSFLTPFPAEISCPPETSANSGSLC